MNVDLRIPVASAKVPSVVPRSPRKVIRGPNSRHGGGVSSRSTSQQPSVSSRGFTSRGASPPLVDDILRAATIEDETPADVAAALADEAEWGGVTKSVDLHDGPIPATASDSVVTAVSPAPAARPAGDDSRPAPPPVNTSTFLNDRWTPTPKHAPRSAQKRADAQPVLFEIEGAAMPFTTPAAADSPAAVATDADGGVDATLIEGGPAVSPAVSVKVTEVSFRALEAFENEARDDEDIYDLQVNQTDKDGFLQRGTLGDGSYTLGCKAKTHCVMACDLLTDAAMEPQQSGVDTAEISEEVLNPVVTTLLQSASRGRVRLDAVEGGVSATLIGTPAMCHNNDSQLLMEDGAVGGDPIDEEDDLEWGARRGEKLFAEPGIASTWVPGGMDDDSDEEEDYPQDTQRQQPARSASPNRQEDKTRTEAVSVEMPPVCPIRVVLNDGDIGEAETDEDKTGAHAVVADVPVVASNTVLGFHTMVEGSPGQWMKSLRGSRRRRHDDANVFAGLEEEPEGTVVGSEPRDENDVAAVGTPSPRRTASPVASPRREDSRKPLQSPLKRSQLINVTPAMDGRCRVLGRELPDRPESAAAPATNIFADPVQNVPKRLRVPRVGLAPPQPSPPRERDAPDAALSQARTVSPSPAAPYNYNQPQGQQQPAGGYRAISRFVEDVEMMVSGLRQSKRYAPPPPSSLSMGSQQTLRVPESKRGTQSSGSIGYQPQHRQLSTQQSVAGTGIKAPVVSPHRASDIVIRHGRF